MVCSFFGVLGMNKLVLSKYPCRRKFYNGRYKFQKSYFGQIEGLKSTGEEFNCAVIIDSLPEVKYWLRNPVRRGFSLPLAHNNFYPDFIAELNDGRILVVEYKGEPYKSNDDSKDVRTQLLHKITS